MHSIELPVPTKVSASRWLCVVCESPWADKATADRCCSSLSCDECGRNVWNGSNLCKDCKPGDRLVLERLLFSRASKVYYHEYEEPFIFWEPGGKRPGIFFRNMTAIGELCVSRGIPTPTWVWGCKPEPIQLSVNTLLPLEHQHLVAETELESLQKYLDAWVSAQKLNTYSCDHSIVVVLDSTLMSDFRPLRPIPELI